MKIEQTEQTRKSTYLNPFIVKDMSQKVKLGNPVHASVRDFIKSVMSDLSLTGMTGLEQYSLFYKT